MMISQTAEYALRAVVCLAGRPNGSLTNRQIARATRVPPDYLCKVLRALVRADLVRSQRGLHGGFVLARDPRSISVLDVVNAVDPLRRIRRCPLGLDGHGPRLCALHRHLDEATALVERAFAASRVSDLLAPRRRPRATCPGPGVSRPRSGRSRRVAP